MTAVSSRRDEEDRGAVLILALVLIIICSLIVIPMLSYITAVTHSSRVLTSKSERVEAVKGGLRVAMTDPKQLYQTCDSTGLAVSLQLSAPALNVPVKTTCSKIMDSTSTDPSNLRYGFAGVQVGATNPPVVRGTPFPGTGLAPEGDWWTSSSAQSEPDKIFLPDLPIYGTSVRSATPYSMGGGFPACLVYFPGKYVNPLTITGSTPVFFTSGIYYFTQPVTISGNANVVFGDGERRGCFDGNDAVSDQDAAFNAINAPKVHGISGLGATLIFGGNGRLGVDNSTAGSGISVVFNKRYVSDTDLNGASSKGVSIVSVNGRLTAGTIADYLEPGVLSVPSPWMSGATRAPADPGLYEPSLFTPDPAPAPPAPAPIPIIDINLTTASAVKILIPDYVALPQGSIRIAVDPTMTAGKDVQMIGGILAGTLQLTSPGPETTELGMVTSITQRTFRITSVTTSGSPTVTSIAIVQVGHQGTWAVNSWAVIAG